MLNCPICHNLLKEETNYDDYNNPESLTFKCVADSEITDVLIATDLKYNILFFQIHYLNNIFLISSYKYDGYNNKDVDFFICCDNDWDYIVDTSLPHNWNLKDFSIKQIYKEIEHFVLFG